MFDVVALGELLIDFTPVGKSEKDNDLYECNPGGAPANVLAVLAKLERKTAFIGKVGKDSFGTLLKGVLDKNNISSKGLKFSDDVNTTITFVSLDNSGDRAFMFYRKPGADMMLKEDEIDYELIKDSKIFHFGSVSMTSEPCRTATLKAAAYARKNGLIVSYDPNLRILLWRNKEEARNQILEGMKYADILKISEEELEFITGFKDFQEGTAYLKNVYDIKLIFVTLGSEGCFYRAGNIIGKVDGYKTNAIDTTGAGDAFLGGALYKIIEIDKELTKLHDSDMRQIVSFANAVGALVTTKKGAISVMPDKAEIEKQMEQANLYRPIYHFLPKSHWMNDPNGVIYYKGEYHMFYQYNPNDYHWGTIHWGHAKSKDLIHWKHLPIALYPSLEFGEEHCFSGCCVINEGVPTIFYTSIGSGKRNQSIGAEQWMAVSKDDMLTWEKYQGNPVLSPKIHGNLEISEWRDPFVLKNGEEWLMVLGGSHDKKACALIYGSKDLKSWKFLNILYEAQDGKEEILECPNLFKINDKYVFVYSPNSTVRYYIGNLNSDYTFTPEYHGTIDHSGWEGFYAPNSLEDPNGRRIMWGWMTEEARGDMKIPGEWAGVHSLPRVLTLNKNNRLEFRPAEELKALRDKHIHIENIQLSKKIYNTGVRGRALELCLEFEVKDLISEFEIRVLCSEDGKEFTAIRYNASIEELSIDRSKSSLSEQTHKSELKSRMQLLSDNKLKLHIFLDHSVIEVFANDTECISTRVYPTKADSEGVQLELVNGDKVKLNYLDIWEMKTIW